MSKVTYGRMLLNEFSNMILKYDYLSYLETLEEERIEFLNRASEEEIKKYRLHKEHYLVRFLRQTFSEIKEIECKYNSNGKSGTSIDNPLIGNNPKYKNDLTSLRVFISKLDKEGYEKKIMVS